MVRIRKRWIGVSALLLFALPLIGDQVIDRSVPVFDEAHAVPEHPVALVLGTAPTVWGRPNLYYERRLDAAAELYHAGRVRGLLVSGDHGRVEYNEPDRMKADLVARGVPAEFITCDYAGFRTLDSVVRASTVFGLDRFVVVSQPFHAKRAVYLARQHGLQATAFAAQNPRRRAGLKQRAREVLARNLALWDGLVGTAPRFGGPPVAVGIRPQDD